MGSRPILPEFQLITINTMLNFIGLNIGVGSVHVNKASVGKGLFTGAINEPVKLPDFDGGFLTYKQM